jgi:sulfate adenylyltransferase subunit 1
VSIILIDARKGVIEQTYRHFLSIIYCKRGHCGDQQNGFGGLFRRSFNKIKADFEALNAKSTLKNKT